VQAPVEESHVPGASWHVPGDWHITGVLTQPVCGLQLSTVHLLPSSQDKGVKTHPPFVVSQLSVVQLLLSLQVFGGFEQVPPLHVPAT
jgi:hypothetical protein